MKEVLDVLVARMAAPRPSGEIQKAPGSSGSIKVNNARYYGERWSLALPYFHLQQRLEVPVVGLPFAAAVLEVAECQPVEVCCTCKSANCSIYFERYLIFCICSQRWRLWRRWW